MTEEKLITDREHIDNLETLVVRLARYLERQNCGDSKLADQAIGYMQRQARGVQSFIRFNHIPKTRRAT